MAEAIKLKLAEMEPSSGGASASASAEGTDTPGNGLVDAQVQSASIAGSTRKQRIGNFRKNLYPRWGTDRDYYRDTDEYARVFLEDVEDLLGRSEFLTGNFRSMFKKELWNVVYDILGGGTSLHWAVRMEDVDLVTAILDADQVDVNAKDEVWKATSLHWAVQSKNMAIVKAMCHHPLAKKFDLSVEDKWGFTALESAILKSNIPMVKVLLQRGNEHLDCVGVIEEVNNVVWTEGSMELLQHYFDSQRETWYINIEKNHTGTSLHWAVRMEDTTLASQILTKGEVDLVNAKESDGSTPLHLALSLENLDMVKIMVAEGKVHVNAIDNNGYTPLHSAILSAKLDVVKIMVAKHLESGNFNVNFVEHETKYSALHCALLSGEDENIDMVRELLKCKGTMRLTEECHSRETPLQIAHERGFKDVQKSLLDCEGVQRFVDGLYRDRQVYVDAANAILVGAALIASVTFASWLQPPLGYGTLGYVDVQHDERLRAFWIFNCLSFYFAIGTVVFGARSVLPKSPYFIKVTVEKLQKNLLVTTFLLAWSVFFVIIAFGIAGCLVLSPTFSVFQLYMIIPIIIGGVVCIVSLVCLSRSMWQDSSLGKNTTLVKKELWKSRARGL